MRDLTRFFLSLGLMAGLALHVPGASASAGAEQYNELLESGAIYDDPEWQAYVTEVGERMLAVSPHRNRTYTFVLLDDTMVNAYTTGDGYVFMTRGLVAYFRTEDEFAAVLGHEIGHVVGNHLGKTKRRNVMAQVLGWMGVLATSSGSMLDLANTLAAAAGADYGRKEELEADAFGADWLREAGYNPQAMVDVVHVLRDNDLFYRNIVGRPTQYHGIFRSHPEHQKRIHELNKIVRYDIPEEVRPAERDFMDMVHGMVFGEDAAAGVVKDSTYYHSSHRIVVAYPEGWQVRNTPTEVVGQPSAGGSSIVVRRQQPPQEKQTPAEYVTETLKRDDVENGRELRIGEFPAFIGDIKVAGDSNARRKIAVIFNGAGVYVFNGELDDAEGLDDFERDFEAVVTSFRPMTAADQRIANSRRIEVIEARPGDSFARLAQGAPIPQHGEEMLRVINGKHPHGEPRAGDLIKVIR